MHRELNNARDELQKMISERDALKSENRNREREIGEMREEYEKLVHSHKLQLHDIKVFLLVAPPVWPEYHLLWGAP